MRSNEQGTLPTDRKEEESNFHLWNLNNNCMENRELRENEESPHAPTKLNFPVFMHIFAFLLDDHLRIRAKEFTEGIATTIHCGNPLWAFHMQLCNIMLHQKL
jgi:hypothetical protein